MCWIGMRARSVKGGSQCWPMAVFYNVLDLAAINAYVLYKECMWDTAIYTERVYPEPSISASGKLCDAKISYKVRSRSPPCQRGGENKELSGG